MSNKSSANSNEVSPTSSLIRLDELSSFGATKQSRLPALIKLNTIDQNKPAAASSLPVNFSESQLEKQDQQRHPSLPIEKMSNVDGGQQQQEQLAEKENISSALEAPQNEDSDDFQVVDMQQEESSSELLIGPSLPHVPSKAQDHQQQQQISKEQLDKSINALQSSLQLGSGVQLGDSLIEMIINLRNENQNLIRALETNNEYVKDRLSEFKRVQEDSKKREAQFALEKAEFEHQVRKLERQNSVLSERLKSMEAKLKDMKLEVSESLDAARSSKASSIRGEPSNMYPLIDTEQESFSNVALAKAAQQGDSDSDGASDNEQDPHQATTMQVDAASSELLNVAEMDTSNPAKHKDFSAMSKEELSEHFDSKKAEFYSLDDPMKQCDKLEQQLNNIGKRDYEICLLQQQLNIYRQDFRLERMEKLEAQIQIEKLKNAIDRLCLERLQSNGNSDGAPEPCEPHYGGSGRRISEGLGKLGHQLTKKAARQAAKAARYASKQAHLEEKAAAALARVAAARASATGASTSYQQQQQQPGQQQPTIPKAGFGEPAAAHHQGRHHHHHHHAGRHHGGRPHGAGVRSEVVSDLLSTANKAMLTGYKMASTHVNLALDKLSQYEQQQASHLEKNKQPSAPSAPMEPPSID